MTATPPKNPTVFVVFTWSLEVDSAELHGVGGMVGRHGFAAGKTALPALGLGPFPGIKRPHAASLLSLHREELSRKETHKKKSTILQFGETFGKSHVAAWGA